SFRFDDTFKNIVLKISWIFHKDRFNRVEKALDGLMKFYFMRISVLNIGKYLVQINLNFSFLLGNCFFVDTHTQFHILFMYKFNFSHVYYLFLHYLLFLLYV